MSHFTPKFATAARFLLGAIFFVFGLNGFFHFLPAPPLAGPAGAFAGALAVTGYMFPLIKGTEVLVGLALLTNRFVPLALVVLAPVSINILLFHTFLAPSLGLPLLIVAAQIFLAWVHRSAYGPVLRARHEVAKGPRSARSGTSTPLVTA